MTKYGITPKVGVSGRSWYKLTTLPQEPQFLLSVLVSVHAPLQSCWVGEVFSGPHS